MAYLVNSIGSYTFLALEGPIELIQTPVQLIERPNVAGVDTRIFAAKGRPFELVSISSHATETAAYTAFNTFVALKAAGLQTLTRAGIDYSLTPYFQKVKVIDVACRATETMNALTGNITTNDKVLLTCSWVLVMEDVTP